MVIEWGDVGAFNGWSTENKTPKKGWMVVSLLSLLWDTGKLPFPVRFSVSSRLGKGKHAVYWLDHLILIEADRGLSQYGGMLSQTARL